MDKKTAELKSLLLSQTAKDTSVLFLGNAISSVLAIMFTVIAARALGPENWGITAGIISFIVIMESVGDFGLGASLFRFASNRLADRKSKNADKLVDYIFSVRLITTFIIFVVLLSGSPFVSKIVFTIDSPTLWIISAVAISTYHLYEFQVYREQTKKDFKKAATTLVLSNLLRLVVTLVFYYFKALTLTNLLLIYALSPLLVFFYRFFVNPLSFFIPRSLDSRLKSFVPFSGAMGINRILGVISGRVDVIIVLHLLTNYETGIYAAAKQLALGVPLIIGSFATVLAPRFATLEKQKLIPYFIKTIQLSLFFVAGLVFGIIVSPLVMNLFGPQYQESTRFLQLLLATYIPFILSTPAVNLIIYSMGKPELIVFVSLIQLLIIVLVNSLLVTSLGLLVTAVAMGISNSVQLLAAYSYVIYRIKK